MILMSDLLRRKAVADGERFPVTELFFDDSSGELRYVALRTGGFFSREEVVIAIRSFSPPDPGVDVWPVALDPEAIESAPVWTEGTHSSVPLALESWPPIIIGPFGNTESPLMLWAQATEAASGHEPPHEHASGDDRVFRLDRVRRRIGAEVFGNDGPLGHLADMGVEPETTRIVEFVILTDRTRHAVPYARLRHFAADGNHLVLDLDHAELEALPSGPTV